MWLPPHRLPALVTTLEDAPWNARSDDSSYQHQHQHQTQHQRLSNLNALKPPSANLGPKPTRVKFEGTSNIGLQDTQIKHGLPCSSEMNVSAHQYQVRHGASPSTTHQHQHQHQLIPKQPAASIHNNAPLQQHGVFDHPLLPHHGMENQLVPHSGTNHLQYAGDRYHGMKAELQHGVFDHPLLPHHDMDCAHIDASSMTVVGPKTAVINLGGLTSSCANLAPNTAVINLGGLTSSCANLRPKTAAIHLDTPSDTTGPEPSIDPPPDPTTPDLHPKLSLDPESKTTSRPNPMASGPPSKLAPKPDTATTPRPDPTSTTTNDAPRAGVIVERADLLQTIRQQRLEKISCKRL